MPTPTVLREVARATDRYGVATSEALQLSGKQVRACCEAGVLECRHRGVYINPSVPPSAQQDLAAAVAAGGVMAAAWGRSAGAIWELVEDFPPTPEIVIPRRRVARIPGVLVHRSTDLCAQHLSRRHGIRVVNPLVTVLDLGVVLDPDGVAEAIVRGTVKRLFTLAGVIGMLTVLARPGRTGIRSVRAAVDFLESLKRPLESVLELRFALMAARFALPMGTFQHWVTLGRRRYRIDFAYPEVMLAIEVDGYGKTADPAAVASSLRRQNALVLAGWTVLRFDWHRVVNQPHEVAAEIRATLGRLGYQNWASTLPGVPGAQLLEA